MNITLNSEEEYRDYMQNHQVNPNDDNELYCVLVYVRYLYSIHRKFTICFQKREGHGPDFKLQVGETKIGLEHTRASCQALTYGEKKLKDYSEGSMLEIPDCQYIEASKESIKEVIRKPGEQLRSVGWGDWGQEKFLIEAILNSIKDKTRKLNKNYEMYPSNELIVYNNISLFNVEWNYVLSELKKQYKKTSRINFDKIHLIADDKLSYDIMSKCN